MSFWWSVTLALVSQSIHAENWETRTSLQNSRVFHGTCAVGGKLYAFGGQQVGGGAAFGSTEEYDPATDSWRPRNEMPSARMGMAVNAVNGKCYLFGGVTEPELPALTLVEEFDPATDLWSRKSDMPTGRVSFASAVVDGKVYVMGGWSFGNLSSSVAVTTEMYDPQTDSWTVVADMPTPRAGHSASALNGRIYAVGGGNRLTDGTLDTAVLEIYDPATDSWSAGANMPTPRGFLASGTIDGAIFAVGGGLETNHTATVEAYDPVSDSWTQMAPMPTARWGPTGTVINGSLYVTGGSTERGVGHNSLVVNEVLTGSISTFEINFGLTGGWFNPETAGQGLLLEVLPVSEQVFVTWFTYVSQSSASHKIGSPDHRWLSGLGLINGNKVEIDLRVTSGGFFDDPADVARTPAGTYGTLVLEFQDCENATMTYDIFEEGLSGTRSLVRLTAPPQSCLDLAVR